MAGSASETSAEDRTQGPSKARLTHAREQGIVAHSPELTASIGLLTAILLLGTFGSSLASILVDFMRAALIMPAHVRSAGAAEVVSALLRQSALRLSLPLGAIVLGTMLAVIGAHLLQTGGLWAPGLLAPDVSRLWSFGRGQGWAERATRGAWGLLKTALVMGLAVGIVWMNTPQWQRLGGLGFDPGDLGHLATALAVSIRRFILTLAAASLALGLADLGLQHRRLLSRLRMTPDEHREDQRATEGDPRLRAHRRRIVRSFRNDPAEVLVGASLVLEDPSGLTLVLSGGPPPRRVQVRAIAQGTNGLRLQAAAHRMGVAIADAPALARRLAGRHAPALPMTPDEMAALKSAWPEG